MSIEFGKIVDDELLVTGGFGEATDSMIPELFKDGYKYLYRDAVPITDYLQGIKERYEEQEDKIIVRYDIVEYNPFKVKQRIDTLKQQLSQWDYKVSKNNEYRDVELPLPYNPTEIHQRNQPLRDEINELENILMNL